MASPAVHKKIIKPSETIFSLNTNVDKNAPPPATVTSPPPAIKSKRATSFVKKKKPPLERGFSAQSALKLNRNICLSKHFMSPNSMFHMKLIFGLSDDTHSSSAADVSIQVTQPSPEVPQNLGTDNLVHVLVHRESEEYHSDLEDGHPHKGKS